MDALKDAIDLQNKRLLYNRKRIDDNKTLAKQLMAKGKKEDALMCIKKNKFYDKESEKLRTMIMNLEQQVHALESMKTGKVAADALKIGNAEFKREIEKLGGVDGIDEVMDQAQENLEDHDEVFSALARETNMPGVEADDDQLAKELEDLMGEDLTEELGKVDLGGQAMPSAPVDFPAAPTKAMTQEEKELAELEASMG
jgi:charged multivesicular body protein 6